MNSYAFLSGERYRLRRLLAAKHAERSYFHRYRTKEPSAFWRIMYSYKIHSISLEIEQIRRKYRRLTFQWKELRDAMSAVE